MKIWDPGTDTYDEYGEVVTGRVTFNNENHTVDPTSTYVAQVGTMSALRTVTLPAANAVPAGRMLTICDESKTITGAFYIIVEKAGSDTILNYADWSRTTTALLKHPGSAMVFRSNGTDKWIMINSGPNVPSAWWTMAVSGVTGIAIPTGVWTPIPWTDLTTDPYMVAGRAQPTFTTTIAAASNGNVLPQGTINVASTSGADSAGYFVINGPPGANTLTVVSYTAIGSGTTFTGCNSTYRGGPAGISTGTLATGQVVTQVIADWTPATPGYYMSIAEAHWASNGTGVRRIRFRSMGGPFYLPGSTGPDVPGLSITNQATQVTMQPAPESINTLTDGNIVEVFQSSGGVLNMTKDGIQSPSIMQLLVSGVSR